MLTQIYLGGRTWLVEEANLLDWLRNNAVQNVEKNKQYREDKAAYGGYTLDHFDDFVLLKE